VRQLVVILAVVITSACLPPTIPSPKGDPGKNDGTGLINAPLPQVRHCLERAEYFCGASGISFVQNPDNQNEYTLSFYGTSGLWPGTPAVIIFTGDEGVTRYKKFVSSSGSTWTKALDEQISRIEACGECNKTN